MEEYLEFFEGGGETVFKNGVCTSLSTLRIAKVLELSGADPAAGPGELREMMRHYFGSSFGNSEGLTVQIGRVIGIGEPISADVLAEAKKYRPLVRQHLYAFHTRQLERLKNQAKEDQER